jgi:hypothetical protein
MPTLALPPQPKTVFDALENEDRKLALHRLWFKLECRKLAHANGSGEGIRRRILDIVRSVGVKNGSTR